MYFTFRIVTYRAPVYRSQGKVASEAINRQRICLPRPQRKHIFYFRLNDSAVKTHDGDGLICRVQEAGVIVASPTTLLGAAGDELRLGFSRRVGSSWEGAT